MIKNYVAILSWTSVFLMVWIGFAFPIENRNIWQYVGTFLFFFITAAITTSDSKKE